MRAVITGATGAVGMALLGELVSRGVETLVLCRRGSRRGDRIPDSKYIKKIDCSLDEIAEFSLAGEDKYDVFYHFAWEGTTGSARGDATLQAANVKYATDAVALAARLGCHTFIGAGSQAEYGRVEGRLTPDTPTSPENEYGIGKLKAGKACRDACRALGIRFVWARILSVYGPYDTEGSMVMSTVKKLLGGERPVFTPGEQIWDYMYSGDAAIALYLLAESERAEGVYCLGSGESRRLREYILDIRDAVSPDADIGLGEVPYAKGQVMYLTADITRLTEDTGFIPPTSFYDGIRKTVEWYRQTRPDLF